MIRTSFLTQRFLAVSIVLAGLASAAAADPDAKNAEPEKLVLPKFAPKKEPDALPPVFSKKAPENIEDLKQIQDQLNKTYEKVKLSVVCLRFNGIVGSGVIVTKDGYVLTAGHVSAAPNRDVAMVFHDGKAVKGTTLGGNHGIDSGLSKITAPGEWPALEIADSSKVRPGQWCFVCSHPGGYKPGRTPPVRLGRVLSVSGSTIATDCILVGGDSGGPLFDMHGRVIGINSRIGQGITQNMHVPTNPFVESWDRLAKGEVFGGNKFVPKGQPQPANAGVYLGVEMMFADDACVVNDVKAGSPAEKAGVKPMDVILKCDGVKVSTRESLANVLQKKKAGDELRLDIRRGEEQITITATLAKR